MTNHDADDAKDMDLVAEWVELPGGTYIYIYIYTYIERER